MYSIGKHRGFGLDYYITTVAATTLYMFARDDDVSKVLLFWIINYKINGFVNLEFWSSN